MGFFSAVVGYAGERLGVRTSLHLDARRSGPLHEERDPFRENQVDVGFLCAPSYQWLQSLDPPSVELVPAAPVYEDSRGHGRPIYFSELLTARQDVTCLDDLRGATWAYNDTSSLSGYHSVLGRLEDLGEDPTAFFGHVRCAGSHLESLRLVARGDVDAAAIDSHVLALQRRHDQSLEALRVVESLGPFPVQPVVARRGLSATLRADLAEALLGMADDPHGRAALERHGVQRFAPVSAEHYVRGTRALLGTDDPSCLPGPEERS
jgi:ABC-type phosphate/phosphonate transport system substrate-binding protein